MMVDKLSKEVAQLQEGQGITEIFLRDPGGFYHKPFHEVVDKIL